MLSINKANFFLIFFILLISFEFLSIMAFVASKQLWVNNLELFDFKFFFLEVLVFGFASYYFAGRKK